MIDWQKDLDRLDDLLIDFGTQDWNKHAPAELVINGKTRERLSDKVIYEALDTAMEYHTASYKKLAPTMPIEKKLSCHKDVPPILGNTIQVIFAYLRGDIEQDEMHGYNRKLKRDGQKYMDDMMIGVTEEGTFKYEFMWKHFLDNAFYTPISYFEKAGKAPKPMHVLNDWNIVKQKYAFLKNMQKRYIDNPGGGLK